MFKHRENKQTKKQQRKPARRLSTSILIPISFAYNWLFKLHLQYHWLFTVFSEQTKILF